MTLLIDEKTVIMCPLLFYSFICRLLDVSLKDIYLIEMNNEQLPEPISIENSEKLEGLMRRRNSL
jgi:hypothetical protein